MSVVIAASPRTFAPQWESASSMKPSGFLRLLVWMAPAGLIATLLIAACAAPTNRVAAADSQVLFVCEHGNVKSLMAASYFNQLASERGLPFHAVSRGTAPDSANVPPAIVKGLRDDGFDVAAFHPVAIDATDVSASRRVILINTTLPANAQVSGVEPEQWSDVPPATADYAAARAALKLHIEWLISDMENSVPR